MADFRVVGERDSVEVEKKENPGRNIVVVCNNAVEQRKESTIPANTKVNTSFGGGYVAGRNGPSNAMYKLKRISAKKEYYEVNPDFKKVANEQLDYWLEKFVF